MQIAFLYQALSMLLWKSEALLSAEGASLGAWLSHSGRRAGRAEGALRVSVVPKIRIHLCWRWFVLCCTECEWEPVAA